MALVGDEEEGEEEQGIATTTHTHHRGYRYVPSRNSYYFVGNPISGPQNKMEVFPKTLNKYWEEKGPLLPKQGPFTIQLRGMDSDKFHVWFTLMDKESWDNLKVVMQTLKEKAQSNALQPLDHAEIQEGTVAMLLTTHGMDGGVKVCRVVIIGIEEEDTSSVVVCDVDYVTVVKVSKDQLFQVPGGLACIRYLGFRAQLNRLEFFEGTDVVSKVLESLNPEEICMLKAEEEGSLEDGSVAPLLDVFTFSGVCLNDLVLKRLYEFASVPIPKQNDQLIVRISYFTEDGFVYYQASHQQKVLLDKIERFDEYVRFALIDIRRLDEDYSNLETIRKRLKPGRYIFAVAYEDDGRYYRSQITEHFESDDLVEVQFMDYGNLQVIPISDLVVLDKMDPVFRYMPPMARLVRLNGFPRLGKQFQEVLDTYSDMKLEVFEDDDDKDLEIQTEEPDLLATLTVKVTENSTSEEQEWVTLEQALDKLRLDE